MSSHSQEPVSRFEIFDRYDPTHLVYDVAGVEGEHIDLRTLGLSWEATDFVVPGDGGLDITISRSFNRLSHTPSDMGHWYFGVPRLQIPTSPWRAPYDPAISAIGTFQAAWANLDYRLSGFGGICEKAGQLVDTSVVASLSGRNIPGIMFAAPITLYVPGEGSKVLLEKRDSADQFPADAQYVTTDNWYARCLSANTVRRWGGFEVVSPRGLRYRFDFINHLVPGEYGLGTSGGWVEMGISNVSDVHGNRINYRYDTGAGGSNLLTGIEASDGRLVTLEYSPGSTQGVDVQGSPLALISRINIHTDDEVFAIEYDYCDFVDFYLLEIGCTDINLGPDKDLPVLQEVRFPDGDSIAYRYNPSLYSANVQLDWGNFEFLLESVRLPGGGTIDYEYHGGYHPILQRTDSPAPRLARRTTHGRDVTVGEWSYEYSFANHIESITVTGPTRKDAFEFFEGLGTYEFRIARYPGQHAWPDTAPTDYDEVLALPKSHTVLRLGDNKPLYRTDYSHALLPFVGEQHYGGNWLGWPTLVLAQIRPRPVSSMQVFDLATAVQPIEYSRSIPINSFDAYAFPMRVIEQGVDVLADNSSRARTTDLAWHHDTDGWFIGLPQSRQVADYRIDWDYYSGNGLLRSLNDGGVQTGFSYDASGNLVAESWLRNGLTHTRELSDYYRGVPQAESYPVDPESGRIQTVMRSVDDLGRVLWMEDGSGNRSSFAYDFMGRIVRVERPDTASVDISYQFNESGHLKKIVIDQASRRRILEVDGFGRFTLLRDYADASQTEAPRAQRWEYDSTGRTKFKSYPFGWSASADPAGIAFNYDEIDRVTRETTTANDQFRSFCYSWECNNGDYASTVGTLLNGFVLTDEEGYQTGFELAALGNPDAGSVVRVVEQLSRDASSVGPLFRATSMYRDSNDNVVALRQGGWSEPGWVREFVYDNRRLVEEWHPETGRTVHGYDERNNLISSRVGNEPAVHFAYDGMNRMILTDYIGEDQDVHYGYNSSGLADNVQTTNSQWQYSYDGAGRLTGESLTLHGKFFPFQYDYDQYGNLTSTAYPSGSVVDYAPDALGNPTRAGEVVSSAVYRDDGSLQRLVYSNGIKAEYRRNSRLMPRERLFESPGGSMLAGHRYTYNGTDNLLRIMNRVDDSDIARMKYDGAGRMVFADSIFGSGSVAYDATDNILSNSAGGVDLDYHYDSQNRLSSVVADNYHQLDFAYDALGNTLRKGERHYLYNEASRLMGIAELPDLNYSYDGNGRRIEVADRDGSTFSIFNKAGQLAHIDSCEKGGQISDFVYLADELVGRIDTACVQGCHP